MTTVIDERVVEMRFNNADFEKNVAQSMQTLDNLKKSLNFKDGAKSLDEIGKAASNFKLSGITETIQEATNKFSVLEIAGVTAIAKITSSIMDMGTKFVKSISVDQVSAGFDRYADKTAAVQTIMAATAKDWNDQGAQMEYVNKQMSKLAWFTDETSYNFNEMVSNIGKFTSNNIDLETSVTAMQGIANWAAISGQNAATASRVMYNMSQAIGAGSMKLMDWKSVENANMATYQFKETAVKTAVELGKLKEVSNGLYETLDGKGVFTIEQFREELKKGWFDNEVILATLDKYGKFTDRLYEYASATDSSASQWLTAIEDYKKGNLDMAEFASEMEISVEEATKALQDLSAEELSTGQSSFRAAQEAKTFGEAIDSVKDAVSTKWSETFELIFGNYLEAKKLWTGLANDLWEAFASGGDERNEVLTFWRELGGRGSLIEGVINFANLLVKPLSTIKRAFKDMFPDTEGMGKLLFDLTERFKNFTSSLQPSKGMLTDIYRTFKGLFTIGKILAKVFESVIKAVLPVTKPMGSLLEMIIRFTGFVGVLIMAIAEYAEQVGWFKAITEGVSVFFTNFVSILKTVLTAIGGGVLFGISSLVTIFKKVGSAISNFVKNSKILNSVLASVSKTVLFLKKTFAGAEKPIEKVTTVVKHTEKNFSAAAESTAKFGTIMKDTGTETGKALTPLQKVGNVIKIVIGVLALAATKVIQIIVTVGKKIGEFFSDVKKKLTNGDEDMNVFVAVFQTLFDKIKEILDTAKTAIGDFFDNLGIDTSGVKEAFDTITKAVGGFVTSIDSGKFVAIMLSVVLLALIGEAITLSSKIKDLASAASGLFNSINKILKKQFFKVNSQFLDIAKGFTLIASSLALLIYVDKDGRLGTVILQMGSLVVVLSLLAGVMDFLSEKFAASRPIEANLHSMSKTLIELALSTAILAGAVAILANIETGPGTKMVENVEAALFLLAGVVGATIAISKFVKTVPVGAVIILTLAFAMRQLVKALAEFSTIPIESVNQAWSAYISLFVGMASVIAASSVIGIRSGIGFLLTAKAITMIVPYFKNIIEAVEQIPVDKFDWCVKVLMAADMLLVTIAGIVFMYSKRGNIITNTVKKLNMKGSVSLFGGVGGALAGFGIAIGVIVSSIVALTKLNLTPEQTDQIGGIFANILGVLGIFVIFIGALNIVENKLSISDKLSTKIAAFGAFMLLFSISLRVIASAVKALTGIEDTGALWAAAGVLLVMGTVLALVVGVSGTVQKAIPAMAALIATTVTFGVLIGEIAVLALLVGSFKDDMDTLKISLGIMIGLFVALQITMRVMGNIENVKAGVVFALAATIAALGAVFVAIAVVASVNLAGAAMAFVALVGVLAVLGVLFTVIGQMDTPSWKKMASIVAVAATIGVIGITLYEVAKQPWESILSAGGMMVAALGMMALVLIVLDKIGSAGGQATAALSLIGIAAAALIVAGAIKVLEGVDWSVFGMFAAAMGVLVGILAGLAVASAVFPPFGVALGVVAVTLLASAAAFGLAALSFALFAAALPLLAEGINTLTPALIDFATVPFLTISEGLSQIAKGLFLLGAAGLMVGLGAIGIGLLAFALWGLGAAAGASVDNLNALAQVPLLDIASGLTGIGFAGIFIGAAAPLLLIGSVALFALGAALMFFSFALQNVGTGFEVFTNGCKAIGDSVDKMAKDTEEKITNIVKAFKQLLPDIAAALADGPGGKTIADAVKNLAFNIAGEKGSDHGIIGMVSKILGWNSPVEKFIELLQDIAAGITAGEPEATSAAGNTGTNIGNSLGENTYNTAMGWFDKIGAGLSGLFNTAKGFFSGAEKRDLTDLKKYGANGMPSALLAAGSAAKEATITGFGPLDKIINSVKKETEGLIGNELDLSNYFDEATKASEEAAEAAKNQAGAYGDLGEAAGKAGKSAKDMAKDLKSTIEGQLDIFSKFEIKTGITGQQMIENMRSNIDGFASWSHRMAVLAQRFAEAGIDKGLYQKLAEMGPKGYETMNAFYEMSEEQLAEVKDLYATSLTLPESQANIVGQGYQYMGEMAVAGFSNALDDHFRAHEAIHGFTSDVINTAAEDLGVHSPSTVFYEMAYNCLLGYWSGSIENSHWAKDAIDFVAKIVIDTADATFNEENFYNYGKYVTIGLANGLLDEDAIAKLVESVTFVTDIIRELMPSNLQEESPSKLTRGFGRYATEGLAIGMLDAAYTVERAAASVADTAIEGYQSAIDSVQNYTDLNTTLLLTPILDMSYLDEQLTGLDQTIGVTAQNGGQFSSKPSETNVTFTQNNYSPKALSRIDIYRQTKNQISMMKGAVANA